MKVNSTDLISRPTQTAARLLTVVSASAILVDLNSLDPNKWQILNGDVTANVYAQAALIVIIFGVMSLIVHWYGDYVAYTKWFKSNEVSMGTLWGMSAPKSTEPPIAGLKRRLGWIIDEYEKLDQAVAKMREFDAGRVRRRDGENQHPELLIEIEKQLTDAKIAVRDLDGKINGVGDLLDELDARFSSLNSVAKFVVFIWYLALPITLGFFAIILILFPMR